MPSEGPILFAYDGSEPAQSAIRQAGRQLSTDRDAIVLTVWQPYGSVPFVGSAAPPPDVEREMEREAQRVAEQGARLARSVGFRATPQTAADESVWRAIVDGARDRASSIVVMGSRGRTGITEALLGSVATAVSRHADRPVMIVHGTAR